MNRVTRFLFLLFTINFLCSFSILPMKSKRNGRQQAALLTAISTGVGAGFVTILEAKEIGNSLNCMGRGAVQLHDAFSSGGISTARCLVWQYLTNISGTSLVKNHWPILATTVLTGTSLAAMLYCYKSSKKKNYLSLDEINRDNLSIDSPETPSSVNKPALPYGPNITSAKELVKYYIHAPNNIDLSRVSCDGCNLSVIANLSAIAHPKPKPLKWHEITVDPLDNLATCFSKICAACDTTFNNIIVVDGTNVRHKEHSFIQMAACFKQWQQNKSDFEKFDIYPIFMNDREINLSSWLAKLNSIPDEFLSGISPFKKPSACSENQDPENRNPQNRMLHYSGSYLCYDTEEEKAIIEALLAGDGVYLSRSNGDIRPLPDGKSPSRPAILVDLDEEPLSAIKRIDKAYSNDRFKNTIFLVPTKFELVARSFEQTHYQGKPALCLNLGGDYIFTQDEGEQSKFEKFLHPTFCLDSSDDNWIDSLKQELNRTEDPNRKVIIDISYNTSEANVHTALDLIASCKSKENVAVLAPGKYRSYAQLISHDPLRNALHWFNKKNLEETEYYNDSTRKLDKYKKPQILFLNNPQEKNDLDKNIALTKSNPFNKQTASVQDIDKFFTNPEKLDYISVFDCTDLEDKSSIYTIIQNCYRKGLSAQYKHRARNQPPLPFVLIVPKEFKSYAKKIEQSLESNLTDLCFNPDPIQDMLNWQDHKSNKIPNLSSCSLQDAYIYGVRDRLLSDQTIHIDSLENLSNFIKSINLNLIKDRAVLFFDTSNIDINSITAFIEQAYALDLPSHLFRFILTDHQKLVEDISLIHPNLLALKHDIKIPGESESWPAVFVSDKALISTKDYLSTRFSIDNIITELNPKTQDKRPAFILDLLGTPYHGADHLVHTWIAVQLFNTAEPISLKKPILLLAQDQEQSFVQQALGDAKNRKKNFEDFLAGSQSASSLLSYVTDLEYNYYKSKLTQKGCTFLDSSPLPLDKAVDYFYQWAEDPNLPLIVPQNYLPSARYFEKNLATAKNEIQTISNTKLESFNIVPWASNADFYLKKTILKNFMIPIYEISNETNIDDLIKKLGDFVNLPVVIGYKNLTGHQTCANISLLVNYLKRPIFLPLYENIHQETALFNNVHTDLSDKILKTDSNLSLIYLRNYLSCSKNNQLKNCQPLPSTPVVFVENTNQWNTALALLENTSKNSNHTIAVIHLKSIEPMLRDHSLLKKEPTIYLVSQDKLKNTNPLDIEWYKLYLRVKPSESHPIVFICENQCKNHELFTDNRGAIITYETAEQYKKYENYIKDLHVSYTSITLEESASPNCLGEWAQDTTKILLIPSHLYYHAQKCAEEPKYYEKTCSLPTLIPITWAPENSWFEDIEENQGEKVLKNKYKKKRQTYDTQYESSKKSLDALKNSYLSIDPLASEFTINETLHKWTADKKGNEYLLLPSNLYDYAQYFAKNIDRGEKNLKEEESRWEMPKKYDKNFCRIIRYLLEKIEKTARNAINTNSSIHSRFNYYQHDPTPKLDMTPQNSEINPQLAAAFLWMQNKETESHVHSKNTDHESCRACQLIRRQENVTKRKINSFDISEQINTVFLKAEEKKIFDSWLNNLESCQKRIFTIEKNISPNLLGSIEDTIKSCKSSNEKTAIIFDCSTLQISDIISFSELLKEEKIMSDNNKCLILIIGLQSTQNDIDLNNASHDHSNHEDVKVATKKDSLTLPSSTKKEPSNLMKKRDKRGKKLFSQRHLLSNLKKGQLSNQQLYWLFEEKYNNDDRIDYANIAYKKRTREAEQIEKQNYNKESQSSTTQTTRRAKSSLASSLYGPSVFIGKNDDLTASIIKEEELFSQSNGIVVDELQNFLGNIENKSGATGDRTRSTKKDKKLMDKSIETVAT